MGDRCQIHVPNTVAELGRGASRDLNCETGLAGATGTGQRHQPVVGQQLPHVSNLCAAADKAGELHWKVMHTNAFRGTQRREIVAQVRMAELNYPFGARQIAQRVSAQIGQPGIGRQTVDDHVLGRAGQHRLPAVRQIAQPRGPIDGRTDVVALVAQLDLTGMDADAQPDRGQRRLLQIQGTQNGIAGAPERDHETVALALFDRPHPVVGGDGVGDGLIEARESGGHLLGLGLPQPRRTFDVCQKQRHRSGRQKSAHA